MVASFDTVAEIAKVIRRHVSDEAYRKILDDLMAVPGNKSFRDTIMRLHALHVMRETSLERSKKVK
jgi:hypothetical protein